MPKTIGLGKATKRFDGKTFRYFRGLFPNKQTAQRQAKILRSEGRLARVTNEVFSDWTGGMPKSHWIVWVK